MSGCILIFSTLVKTYTPNDLSQSKYHIIISDFKTEHPLRFSDLEKLSPIISRHSLQVN